jgi:ATP-dependent RNA helicase DDX19/DBP5
MSSFGQSIIFVNSRKAAFDVAKLMKDEGLSVSVITGSSNQASSNPDNFIDSATRDKVLEEFMLV